MLLQKHFFNTSFLDIFIFLINRLKIFQRRMRFYNNIKKQFSRETEKI